MAQHEEVVRYTCDTTSEVAMRLFFRSFLERQPRALNVAMVRLSDAKATWSTTTQYLDDLREEIECRTQLLEALRPFEAPTQVELEYQQSGKGVNFRKIPCITCDKLHVGISASLLLPVTEARQFIATLLAARGINTWAQAVHLTEHSPCFQGVPEWLVTRTLMIIERIKARDARSSLSWPGRVADCAGQWTKTMTGLLCAPADAVYDSRTSQASRKDL
eukprot:TRINITY_DN31229_c0_g1_i1.p1 TRINITY_DN31229_c0_g1~~TRINITY_DN31229_c0_g1_i1.p1  ORF type:complete len:219 (-),score=12.84 TRINITY_DN31229_c0_g1_i1:238-894(-)